MRCLKIILHAALIVISIFASGQSNISKKKKFGILLGIGLSDFKVSNSNWWSQPPINYTDSLTNINSTNNISVTLGLCYILKLNKNLSIRPSFNLLLNETGKLNYNRKSKEEILDFQSSAIYLPIPLLFRLTQSKISSYLIIGPYISYSLGSAQETTKIKLNKFDLGGQIGIGIDIPTKHFNLSPEFSVQQGFINAKNNGNNNLYSNTINKLNRQYFNLSFCLTDRN